MHAQWSLVTKSTLGTRATAPVALRSVMAAKPATTAPKPRRPARRGTGVSDRIDAATQELASGLAKAATAASQLQHAIDQISAGAEEAAGAAQGSSGLISALAAGFAISRERAEASRRQSEFVQNAFLETNARIEGSVAAIEANAKRHTGSVRGHRLAQGISREHRRDWSHRRPRTSSKMPSSAWQ